VNGTFRISSFSPRTVTRTATMEPNTPKFLDCEVCSPGLFDFFGGFDIINDAEARKLTQQLSPQLFHGTCKRCDEEETTFASDATALCTFCQHLRLRHLLCCVEFTKRPLQDAQIKFCKTEDAAERMGDCSFCRLIIRSALPYRYLAGLAAPSEFDDSSLTLELTEDGILPRLYFGAGGWEKGRLIRYRDRHASTIESHHLARSEGTFLGGSVSRDVPLVGSYINWDLAARWLSHCYREHEDCTGTGNFTLPASFRVIDVDKRCLVQAPSNCSYVALSYVWGRNPNPAKLLTTRSNIEKLREEGGLSASDMPITVENAIEACRRLGETYLWVDRFCIIQDDPQDKGEQIVAMAAIYWLAKFAIIVTDGDSDSGIAGIGHERAQQQISDEISGFKFTNEPAGWREIISGSSVWSTRGWTYQEAILPRRKLYLTESQAVFECGEHIVGEDGSEQRAMHSPYGLKNEPWNPLVETFYEHLIAYRSRSLTNTSDIYNAIDGVASALYGNFGSIWKGLPRQEFDEALLWRLDGYYGRGFTGPANNGTVPSWSWSSTNRDVSLLYDCNRSSVRYCDTLVAWGRFVEGNQATSDAVESVRTIPGGKPLSLFHKSEGDCRCSKSDPMSENAVENLLCLVVAWTEGCLQTPCPFEKPRDTTFTALRSRIISQWACQHEFWLDALRDTMILSGEESFLLPHKSSTILASAQSTFFQLQGSVQKKDESLGNLCIVDEDGQPVGLLMVEDPGLNLEASEISGKKFEFIALSMSTTSQVVLLDGDLEDVSERDLMLTSPDDSSAPDGESEAQGASEPEWERAASEPETGLLPGFEETFDQAGREKPHIEGRTFWDGDGGFLFPLPVVNVMMIERVGENLAKRITVGWIYLTSWSKAKRQFRTVYLQ